MRDWTRRLRGVSPISLHAMCQTLSVSRLTFHTSRFTCVFLTLALWLLAPATAHAQDRIVALSPEKGPTGGGTVVSIEVEGGGVLGPLRGGFGGRAAGGLRRPRAPPPPRAGGRPRGPRRGGEPEPAPGPDPRPAPVAGVDPRGARDRRRPGGRHVQRTVPLGNQSRAGGDGHRGPAAAGSGLRSDGHHRSRPRVPPGVARVPRWDGSDDPLPDGRRTHGTHPAGLARQGGGFAGHRGDPRPGGWSIQRRGPRCPGPVPRTLPGLHLQPTGRAESCLPARPRGRTAGSPGRGQ